MGETIINRSPKIKSFFRSPMFKACLWPFRIVHPCQLLHVLPVPSRPFSLGHQPSVRLADQQSRMTVSSLKSNFATCRSCCSTLMESAAPPPRARSIRGVAQLQLLHSPTSLETKHSYLLLFHKTVLQRFQHPQCQVPHSLARLGVSKCLHNSASRMLHENLT